LKADWDPSQHPRLGAPPNPGWFAATNAPSPPAAREAASTAPDPAHDDAATDSAPFSEGEATDAGRGLVARLTTWRGVLTAVREALKAAADNAIETGRFVLWTDPAAKIAIELAIQTLSPTPAGPNEQRTIDQTHASFDPPKTIDELRSRPTRFALGYQRHHIVGQDPANLAKSPLAASILKFGRAALEDPRNLVWIPWTRHELITGFCNSKDPSDPAARIRRRLIEQMSFEDQYQTGLEVMQLFGVLQ
jgi:hypothetical protein